MKVETVDYLSSILAVSSFNKSKEVGWFYEGLPDPYFIAIYLDERFLDTLRFIEESSGLDNESVGVSVIKFFPKEKPFPVLLFPGEVPTKGELLNLEDDPMNPMGMNLSPICGDSLQYSMRAEYDPNSKTIYFVFGEYSSRGIGIEKLIETIEYMIDSKV